MADSPSRPWRLPFRKARRLHQFLTGATSGDAITTQALIFRRWLRDEGYDSHIYAQHVHESMLDEVQPLSAYRRGGRSEAVAIYHHSIGSDVAGFLQAHGPSLILVHHNVTPAHFFTHVDPAWAQRARLGAEQLRQLRPAVALALADSAYNELELHEAGYEETRVVPIVLEAAQYDLPDDPAMLAALQAGGPNLLFVGRLAPNKRQEDLVKLLYCLRRLRPTARLLLVGDRWDMGYDGWVERLAAELDLSDAVTLTGKVSQQAMVTAYRHADLYVSMSEHEGFGKPLVESMLLDLPVLAYAAASVPYTLGASGVKFYHKDFERLAELVAILLEDGDLRARLIAGQRQKAQQFLESNVRARFLAALELLKL